MTHVEEKVNHYSEVIRNSGKKAEELIETFTYDFIENPDRIWEGMALLMFALDTNADRNAIEHLYVRVYQNDQNASRFLNDADYDYFFSLSLEVSQRVAEFSGAGWHFIANQYIATRWKYRHYQAKEFEARKKAAEMRFPMAMGSFLMIIARENPGEEGRKLVKKYYQEITADKQGMLKTFFGKKDSRDAQTQAEIKLWADLSYSSYQRGEMEPVKYRKTMETLMKRAEEVYADNKFYLNIILADAHSCISRSYLPSEDWKKVEYHCLQEVKYRGVSYDLGMLYTYRGEEVGRSLTDAIRKLEKVYVQLTTDAAEELGKIYSQSEDFRDLGKALMWLERGAMYGNAFCCCEAAIIYLAYEEHRNVERALELYNRCVELRYAPGIERLADVYKEGVYVERNYEKAHELHQLQYECGDAGGIHYIGRMYEDGLLTPEPDFEKAFECFRKGAEGGEPASYSALGRYYHDGIVVEADLKKAAEWFKRGVDEGEPYAMFQLALMCEINEAEGGFERAFELLSQAAEYDYLPALYRKGRYLLEAVHIDEPDRQTGGQYVLKAHELAPEETEFLFWPARCYLNGWGTEVNVDKGVELLKQGADNDNAHCQTELALLYENGHGVEENPTMAVEYMKKAAEQGYPYAVVAMGDFYWEGFGPILEDNKEAVKWYEKAAETESPKALVRLGDYYLYDYDDLNQPERAYEYYRRAAEQGWYSDGLGICHEAGLGVEASDTEAYKYYLLSANDGNPRGKYRVGLCLHKGIGVKADKKEALKWFGEAAEDGYPLAMAMAGKCYLYGEGCEPQLEKGIELLQQAAEQGNDKAQFELGNAYLTGTGVDENEETAMYWYEQAAENGNEDAQKLIGKA